MSLRASRSPLRFVAKLTAIALVCASCATQAPAPVAARAFPPPPEQPRFIYDGALHTSRDVEVTSFGDKIRQLATGVQTEPTGLAKPYAVVAGRGRVYVSDTQQRAVLIFDLVAHTFKTIGNEGAGVLQKPLGMALSSSGELFVADISAGRVVVFDSEGKYSRAIGDKTSFKRPTSVAIDDIAHRLYVVDAGGIESDDHRVFVFDPTTGAPLGVIGKRGTGEGEFNLPLHAAVGPDGTLYVVDSGNFRVQAFNRDGSFSRMFGSLGRRSGQFSRPKGVAVDREGNVFVVDAAFGNFQVFDTKGNLLLFVGERNTSGGPGGFMLPAGITVGDDGRIYVVDQFFRKVDIFRPAELPAQH